MNQTTTIGIATMLGREKALQDALNSLVNQADKIQVYFNNFDGKIPEYLTKLTKKNTNIEYFFSENEIGDLTDFGGFYKSPEAKGYFISCDDDLIYPSNFVENIIKACKKYDNKCIVGYHGRIYSGKVKSYYHGHKQMFHISQPLQKDVFTHIVAGCALCFHTDTFNVDITKLPIAEYPRMKDIHIGIESQKKQVPKVVLAHTGKEFKISKKYQIKNSIHQQEHNRDSKQVELFNSINWPLHKYFVQGVETNKSWYITNKGKYWFGEKSLGKNFVRKLGFKEIDISEVPQELINPNLKKDIFSPEIQITK